MRIFRRPTTIVILVRCLVLTFAGKSTVVAMATVKAPTVTGWTRAPPRNLFYDKALRFSRKPPPSTSGISSTAHDRTPIVGVGRFRHRDVVSFRKSRNLDDVIAPTDDYVDLSSGINYLTSNDIRHRVEDNIDNKVSKFRTHTLRTDNTSADDGTKNGDDTAATARRRLPNVIIIGAKKSGTRALLEFLKIHPDVRAAGPEMHFFDRFYDRGFDWYRSRMPATTSGQLTVEKTPSYLVSGRAVERVFLMDPDVRLLVVVRDPVTRAVSDYTQAATKRPDIAPFEQLAFVAAGNLTNSELDCWTANETGACKVNTSWGAIRIGLYVRHVSRWLRRFPLSQMHFVHGEQLVTDPAGQMRLVEQFLRLRPVINQSHFQLDPVKGFPCIIRSSSSSSGAPQPHCLGKTKGRTHPKIADGALRRLRDFFRLFNDQLYNVVGVDFGWS